MVTDTYPGLGMREQKIYLMNMKTEAVLSLGRFIEPKEFYEDWRCDIHPSWSPNGNIIGFNSAHTGSRQVYIIKLGGIPSGN
jgi:Tol biopolymer transport system component